MSLARRLKRHLAKKNGNRVAVDLGRSKAKSVNPKAAELENPDKPHPLDPPHILSAFEDDHIAREEGLKPPPNEKFADPLPHEGYRPPLTQFTVDCIKLRVLKVMADRGRRDLARGKELGAYSKVQHLWFPEPYADNYEARQGNPPPDSARPKHMRGIDLVLDLFNAERVVMRAKQFRTLAKFVDFRADPRPTIHSPYGKIQLPVVGRQ